MEKKFAAIYTEGFAEHGFRVPVSNRLGKSILAMCREIAAEKLPVLEPEQLGMRIDFGANSLEKRIRA